MHVAAGRPDPNSRAVWGAGSRRVALTCDRCGTEFVDYKSRANKAKRHYCGNACHLADRQGDRNPKWRGGKTVKTCTVCGKSFARHYGIKQRNDGARDGVYCSRPCRNKGIRIHENARIAHRTHGRRREARERASGAITGHHTEAQWRALLKAHSGRCVQCGSKHTVERDHIIPLSKGGNDLISNIQPLCKRCNCSKHNRIGRCGYLL